MATALETVDQPEGALREVREVFTVLDPLRALLARTSAGRWERADGRTRTGDPFITSEVLYQLSYVGPGLASLAALPAAAQLRHHVRVGRQADGRVVAELLGELDDR